MYTYGENANTNDDNGYPFFFLTENLMYFLKNEKVITIAVCRVRTVPLGGKKFYTRCKLKFLQNYYTEELMSFKKMYVKIIQRALSEFDALEGGLACLREVFRWPFWGATITALLIHFSWKHVS